MPISRGPTAFASTISVKSNLQKSWSSNLSVNNENGTSLNENFLGKNEECDRENILIQVRDSANQELLYEPQEFEPACDSLVPSYSFPDAPEILSRLPQEGMPAKDATQFISPSLGQQRIVIARQLKILQAMLLRLSKNAAGPVSNLPKMHYLWRSRHTRDHIFGESEQHRTDETGQLEKQYFGRERLNRNSEKEVILSVKTHRHTISEAFQSQFCDSMRIN